MNLIYNKILNRDIPNSLMKKICENKWTPANIIFHIINYINSDALDEDILDKFIEK
jgi:hypothetical protein